MFHTHHKQALEKLATCKITFQTSEAHKICMMNQLATGQNSVIEDRWKALEWAELSVSQPQDMTESEMLLEWPEN